VNESPDRPVGLSAARRIETLLRPFHGTRDTVPDLPPAKVSVDFEEAGKRQKAA
jgi:hypothetical protein